MFCFVSLLQKSTPRSQSPGVTDCTMTMYYFGPNIKLDSELSENGDEIIVEQQPSGTNSLVVFRGRVKKQSKLLIAVYFIFYCLSNILQLFIFVS